MTKKLDIPLCAWCSEPLPERKKTGRPRLYCDDTCKVAAFRHRELVAALDGAPIEPAGDRVDAPASPGISTDEQVARAVLEAKNLGGAFLRLGREARPEFAWRCSGVGTAILSALDKYFEEAVR